MDRREIGDLQYTERHSGYVVTMKWLRVAVGDGRDGLQRWCSGPRCCSPVRSEPLFQLIVAASENRYSHAYSSPAQIPGNENFQHASNNSADISRNTNIISAGRFVLSNGKLTCRESVGNQGSDHLAKFGDSWHVIGRSE